MEKMLDHLHNRHMDTNLHTVWVDETDRVATFPLWTVDGLLSGYQAYRPEADKNYKNDKYGKYYTFRGYKHNRGPNENKGFVKRVSVWGMESWYLSNTLFVTEGIFDAARITALGFSAVAVIGNDPDSSTRNWFKLVRQMRPVVAVCDPGSAGFKLHSVGHQYHIVDVPNIPNADLSDAPQWYVDDLIQTYRNFIGFANESI